MCWRSTGGQGGACRRQGLGIHTAGAWCEGLLWLAHPPWKAFKAFAAEGPGSRQDVTLLTSFQTLLLSTGAHLAPLLCQSLVGTPSKECLGTEVFWLKGASELPGMQVHTQIPGPPPAMLYHQVCSRAWELVFQHIAKGADAPGPGTTLWEWILDQWWSVVRISIDKTSACSSYIWSTTPRFFCVIGL